VYFKKVILLLFILISLNSLYQPVQFNNIRYRHTIVRQINPDEDSITKEVLECNKIILFREYISLNINIMVIDKEIEINNTS
jgi:hypothetical protein